MKNFLSFYLFILFTTSAWAHQSALSYLLIEENSNQSIDMTLKKPMQDLEGDDLKLVLPSGCEDVLPTTKYQEETFMFFKRSLYCGDKGIEGKTLWINNLLESDKGVIFRYESFDQGIQNKLIIASDPFVLINISQEVQRSFLAYLWLGVEHILLGFDHLLFVLALLLLVSSFKILIQTITAFTFSHSITLGLATLGFIHFSVAYIEAMIALSIVFLARELLIPISVKTVTKTYPWLVAFLFGLLHGLGFASVLADIGLEANNIFSSLLFFNLGVELGQLMFILSILTMIWTFQKFTKKYQSHVRKATSYFIGIIAAYWFIERFITFLT